MASRSREFLVNVFFAAGFFAGVAAIYWARLQGEFADLIGMMAGAYAATWFAVGWRLLRRGPPDSRTTRLFVVTAILLLAVSAVKAGYSWLLAHQPMEPIHIDMSLLPVPAGAAARFPWQGLGVAAAIFIPGGAPWLVMIFSPRYRAFRSRGVLGLVLSPLAPVPIIILVTVLMGLPLH